MGMRKSNALAMMTMLAMANDGFRHDFNNETLKKPLNKKPIKEIIPKGLKEFFYGEKVIYSLNKKNADRKALKQGLIIHDVVKPFVCSNGCGKNGDMGSCIECVGK